jgi:hypothetical protein
MKVSIVYDAFGEIISVSRPSANAKVIVLGESGRSVLTTDVDDRESESLLSGYRVDPSSSSLVNGLYGGAAGHKKSD